MSNYCNLDYLKSISKPNIDFVKQIISIFLKENPLEITGIGQGIKSQNWKKAFLIAHKIKPSFSLLGVPEDDLAILIEIVELTRTENSTHKLAGLFMKLENCMQFIYEDLNAQLIELEKQ